MARELHTPFQCPCDTPVGKLLFDPAKSIVPGIGSTFQVFQVFQKEVLEFRQLEKKVFLFLILCRTTANGTGGFFKLPGFQVFTTTLVTFISSCILATVRTDACNIPVRKETVTCGTICYLDHLWINISFFN